MFCKLCKCDKTPEHYYPRRKVCKPCYSSKRVSNYVKRGKQDNILDKHYIDKDIIIRDFNQLSRKDFFAIYSKSIPKHQYSNIRRIIQKYHS